ncbi:uncharacterized protein BDCG_04931 [Blastomyces dermatitidis ER-3]|uniref:Uncharacterized protein n=1 Tax=Ajellomyces dermatitidis (strain ER-3 / ATCC MYA-2586) TaxID=559297 RepID=A0ABP2EZS3_AJEDR|nr:uncharacterized protein BDCG_04931 [Blastomyces dermatitidis ER-3]EEQ89811.1 hypothetical protein BDCG_04931 [Blastomyces dermatitidis ER-3]
MAASQTTSAATSATPPSPASTAPPPDLNLRNPLPLSATQEAQVRDIYYKRVRGYCAPEIKEWFAGREERRRARELEEQKTAERRREVIQMMREDEERRRKAEAERVKKGWLG